MPEEGGPFENGGFAELLGIEPIEVGDEGARARLAVTDDLLQPHGVVHGGAISALAESVCSKATDNAVRGDGMVAIGQSIETRFLRPITEGHLNATARQRHHGRTTWVWDVEIADDEERLCALARMTIAVRPAR